MLKNRGRKIVKLKDVPTSPIFSQALIDDYEKKSIQFKKQLRGLLADDIASYEKQIKRSMPYTDLTTISDTLSKDEDFISSIVRNRKVDKDLLETNLDMSFPDYNFSSKDVNLIKKLVEKSLGGV